MTSSADLDPAPLLAGARTQFVGFDQITSILRAQDAEARLVGDASADDFAQAMSARLTEAVKTYQSDSGTELTALRYTVVKNGAVQAVLDAGRELPDQRELVHLSASVSIADADRLSVVAEELIAVRPTGR